MTDETARGALGGVRVLDLTTGIAGPVATMLLADLGAEVIRVEEPEPTRAQADTEGAPMWHRLKTVRRAPRTGPEAARLVVGADVVVTDGADLPGPLGDRTVHVAMPVLQGLLDDAPDVDARTANAFLSAATGVARRQSSSSGGPVDTVYPHLAYVHGLWAATVTVAALIERERSGRGQVVTVDGMHGTLVAATTTIVVDPRSTPPMTAVGPGGPNPAYTSYRCADGRWLFLGGLTDMFQRTAFRLLGVSDIFEDPRIGDLGERLYAPENRGWVRARVAAGFATRPRAEWLDLLAANDVPSSPVESRDEWLDHPQVVALDQRREVDDPLVGPVVMPWTPVGLHGTPAVEPRPRRYVDRAEWADRTDRDVPAPAPSDESRGPLAGVTVLDLGTVLAGPYAGMLLAELGADVVKVEPVAGDAFRVRGYPHNRGQRSLAVDLRAEGGYAAFTRLVADADIVLDNFRPGVLQRLRIDHDTLRGIRPDVVSVSITGYGEVGPLAGRPGFDPVLQAMSGMMSAQGGDTDPVFFTLAVNDVTAAAVSALGAVAALYGVVTGGPGQYVSTTLTAVAAFMQSGELVRYDGRDPAPVGGPDHAGPSDLSRHLATADGFVRVHVDAAEQIPADRATLSSAEAVRRIRAAGGEAVVTRTFVELAADPVMVEREYLEPVTWPDGRTTFLPGRYAQFGRTQEKRVLLPPGLGEHTREVLSEAGIAPAEIDALFAAGSLAESGPLPSVADVGYR